MELLEDEIYRNCDISYFERHTTQAGCAGGVVGIYVAHRSPRDNDLDNEM